MDAQQVEQLTKDSQNLKLLYVEDDEEARESTLTTLSLFFQDITIAVDGLDALNTFKKGHFDMIITDINMPNMNGIDMIIKIREINKNVVILVLSAHDNKIYFEQTIKAGIDGYLLKPIDLEQFIDLMYKSVNHINREKELLDYKQNLEQKVEEQTQKIKEHLYTDSLTGLFNFVKLEDDIESGKFETLIIYDITQLSLIVKQYGRAFSSKLLVKVARSLEQNITPNMRLYKLESDKFAILCSEYSHKYIKEFCEQILAYYDMTPLDIDGIDLTVTFSIGISQIKEDLDSTINAEYALSNAKRIGRRHYFFYDVDDNVISEEKEVIKWLKITKELIEKDAIFPYYQALLDIKTDKIYKYEVLARAEIDGKIIAPFYFLDAAEKLGLMSSITRMIIQKSFRFFSQNNYEFSINISQRDLLEGYLVGFFEQKLELYGIDPSRVTLEILENVTISINGKQIQNELDNLKNMGFSIAIDDFGVENSNFGRLVDINFDIVKIDGFFIKNLAKSSKDRLIVESIVSLARTLGMKIVAEYVENKEILDVLIEMGVDYAQGYYIGKPEDHLI